MPALNPYASFLADRDPIQAIAQTPAELGRLKDVIGASRLEQSPAPGKWSPRQIFCHLADCEVVFAFRLRQTLAEDNPTIQPFDQDAWAKPYPAYTAEQALAVFSSLREWNLALVRSAIPQAWEKKLTHPERGTMNFRTLVETMGGHDINHLRQLEAFGKSAAAR